jgi:hypothetical protein
MHAQGWHLLFHYAWTVMQVAPPLSLCSEVAKVATGESASWRKLFPSSPCKPQETEARQTECSGLNGGDGQSER